MNNMETILPAPLQKRDYLKPVQSLRRKAASVFGVIIAAMAMPLITYGTPGPVVQLLWTTQPAQTFTNAPFGRQPVLVTADANGNPSTVDLPGSVPVTVSLVSGGTLLGGPLSFDIGTNAGSSNGIATFRGMEIDTVGSYQLQAVTGTGNSGVFTPTNGLPNCILWLDAADTNTFQLNSSNGIVVWTDKSGTANNAVWSGVTNPPLPYNAPAPVTETNFPSGTWAGRESSFSMEPITTTSRR
jgi:hypothetical protein